MKKRLDQALVERGLVSTRSQAESYIKLGDVEINGSVATKPGQLVGDEYKIVVTTKQQYVNRAALKLASVATALKLEFKHKTILDVGSSTGGFSEYALRQGAAKVIAVDVGTNQMHVSLRADPRIELHEQTDIRDFVTDEPIDIVLADVSFISLREILPHILTLVSKQTLIAVMVKPQFEARLSSLKHKGVIKNDHLRRDILKEFETWVGASCIILGKADSEVAGSKGNLERFYLLRKQ